MIFQKVIKHALIYREEDWEHKLSLAPTWLLESREQCDVVSTNLPYIDWLTRNPRCKQGSWLSRYNHAEAFTSDLERLDLPSMQDQTRWRARVVIRLFLRDSPIRLISELLYFDEWLAVLEKRSLNVRTNTEQRPSSFQITLNNNQEYEVRDESSDEIIDLPVIWQNQASISQIVDILEHLARFRLVRDLENKTSAEAFERSFDIQSSIKKNALAQNTR